jgi:hypothetical protein
MNAEDLDARHAEARRVLLGIPGVVGVGFGYRERSGELTGELAARVYVREKRPPDQVDPDELIPPQVARIPTDVLRVPETTDLACEILDSFDPVIGGIGISNLKGFLGSPTGGNIEMGTLGCLATLNQSSSRDNFVLLTNNHVLAGAGGVKGDTVYQPKLERDSSGNFKPLPDERLHPIGKSLNLGLKGHQPFAHTGEPSVSYYLDCAIASVSTCFSSWCDTNLGTGVKNEIHTLAVGGSSAVEGIARVRPADLPPGGSYTVTKVGQSSGKTVGKVTDALGTVVHPSGLRNNCLIVVHTGPSCGGGTRFAEEGDSGSVIVNDQRKVVGLLFGGNASGQGHGSHIDPVLDLLGITLVSTAHPIAPTGGGTLRELTASADGEDVAQAALLRATIVASERGRAYRDLVDRHREEVMALVNHVRPVTIAWHRVHGPDYLAHAVHASRHADHRVPRAIDGVDREAAFVRLHDALAHHGSDGLRADLERHADEVRRLVVEADNLDDVAERVGATPAVAL